MSLLSLLASSGSDEPLYSDDVFQSFVRVGTGASATITTGIDLATYGGLVWTKGRSGATDHKLTDTVRGATKGLITDTTAAQTTDTNGITAFSTTGHTVGSDSNYNTNAATYVDWVFRKAAKFFDVVSYTGDGTSNRQIPHSLGIVPGMIIVKCTSSADQWEVYHVGAGVNKELRLNSTAAAGSLTDNWQVTSSTFHVTNDVTQNISGATYVAYLFAHDTSTDGIVQCGSFTTNGSAFQVSLGFEPQYIMMKQSNGVGGWLIIDNARGMPATGTSSYIQVNSSVAEGTGVNWGNINATGFIQNETSTGNTYIYLAIRRPNKLPTTGTQVYNAIARTGTGAAATVTGVGFAPDLYFGKIRNNSSSWIIEDRMRGALQAIFSDNSNSESSQGGTVTGFDSMDGVSIGAALSINNSGYLCSNHFFKRTPSVFSILCYTGSGANKIETHDLGAIPELWLVKSRSSATGWVFGSSLLNNTEYVACPSPNGRVTDATMWNSTYPTSTSLSLGTSTTTNASAATFVCYMWASLAGISKVFTYTGNGTSQDVNCGFSTGVRFVMIIRVTASTAQDIFLWDSTRGIIAGNDPHLSLNTTSAEVTTDDSIDPLNSGFTINQVAATNVNVNGAVYIGLAYA